MNPSPRSSLFLLLLWTALIGVASAATSGGIAPGSPATKHWTADNGNGTYSNPLFYEEFEDPMSSAWATNTSSLARPCT